MEENITGGSGSGFWAALTSFVQGLFKVVDDVLTANGNEVVEEKDVQDEKSGRKGKYQKWKSANGNIIRIIMYFNTDNEKTVDLKLKFDNEQPVAKNNVRQDKIEDVITKFCEDHDLGTSEYDSDLDDSAENGEDFEGRFDEELSMSKQIRVSLQKVNGSTDVRVTKIYANYSIVEAKTDLDEILADESFVSQMSDDEETYNITTTDDSEEFDVERTDEEVPVQDCYANIAYAFQNCMNCLQYAQWESLKFINPNVCGTASGLYPVGDINWMLSSYVDTFGRLSYLKSDQKVHMNNLPDVVCDGLNNPDELNMYAQNALVDLVSVLESYYPNIPHEIQGQVDNALASIKEKIDMMNLNSTAAE